MATTGGDDLFLCAVQRPGRGKTAGILRGIGVADHHFLMPRDARPIPGYREKRVDHRAGALKIGGGLEQRHDALWVRISGELLEEHDGEHVGRAARHRDHVRAERLGRQRRCHAEGVEHVANRRRDAPRRRPSDRPTSAFRSQSRGRASRRARLQTRPQTRPRFQTPRDPRDRLGMTGRLLTHVERRQHEPERRDAPQNIREAPGGNQPIAGRHERAMADQQAAPRTRRPSRNGGGAPWSPRCVLDLGGGVRARRAEARRDAAQQRAIGFGGVRRPSPAIRRRRRRSKAPRAAHRSLAQYRSAATHRAIHAAWRVISGVTLGLPSRSPPIHDPKRNGAASSASGSPIARSICRMYRGSASHSVCSNTARPPRTSSSGDTGPIAHFLGLPHRRDLPPQIVERGVGFLRRQVRPIADGEQVADPAIRLQQRAANDLGRVRREHQLDAQRLHCGGERIGRQTVRAPARERICA